MDKLVDIGKSVQGIKIYVPVYNLDKLGKMAIAELAIKKGSDKIEFHFTPHVKIQFEKAEVIVSDVTVMNDRNEFWLATQGKVNDEREYKKVTPTFVTVHYAYPINGDS
jgi:hypothetical protein